MTAIEFAGLDGGQIQELCLVMELNLNNRAINVLLEKTIIPPGIDADVLRAWALHNADEATRLREDGLDRHAGGPLGRVWTWVFRVFYENGDIAILQAPGNG